ncbi:MAG: hypothetical protein EXR98_16655 [Gemmataceae bacterium]|nr:hypothetical protein [Gemmataceae bacterium]
MSNKSPRDASLQTTKQMLDELDALMERMLSLPVNDPGDAAPFPEEVVKTPALSAKLTLLEAPPLPVSPPHLDLARDLAPERLEHPPLNPPHMLLHKQSETPPAPHPEPLTNDVMPPSLAPLLTEIPEPESPSTQPVFQTLLWLNQAFDGTTHVLGGAGGWLRGQVGRMLLGFSGVALLMVAIGWFLKDYLGWN